MTEKEPTPYKDFYWYAKSWYVEGDVKEDLLALVRAYSVPTATLRDALIVLANAVEEYIWDIAPNSRHLSVKLQADILKRGCEIGDTTEGWIRAHLFILAFAQIKDDGDVLVNMGSPSNCLDLVENYYEKHGE